MTRLILYLGNEKRVEVYEKFSFSKYFATELNGQPLFYGRFDDLVEFDDKSFESGIHFTGFTFSRGIMTFQGLKDVIITFPEDIDYVNFYICDPGNIVLVKASLTFFCSPRSGERKMELRVEEYR